MLFSGEIISLPSNKSELKNSKIIGRGTPWDVIAKEALKQKKSQLQKKGKFRCESGLGASGFPHIGSFSDGARAHTIKLAIEEIGFPAEYIAYSDDLDGLRKVPSGLEKKGLEEFLAVPVSKIPDPFDCHKSFGEHMSSLLLEALDQTNIEYHYRSATELYENGAFTSSISTILDNAKKAGEIIKEVTSQDKYEITLPFHAICENCGRIYTTRPIKYLREKQSVEYICDRSEIGGNLLEGCNHQGIADYSKGEGKLSWKVEFAARWATLGIDFEAYGKDILESVEVNDRICREILGLEPPYHVRYEVFLQKGGKKMSKSAGGALTPQTWLKYGNTQSLLLLMLKRIEGSRSIGLEDIPIHMDEYDQLESIFFGLQKIKNPAIKRKSVGLYEYSNLLKVPEEPSIHVPYNLLTTILQYAPVEKEIQFTIDKLSEYGYIRQNIDELKAMLEKRIPTKGLLHGLISRIHLAKNWLNDVITDEEIHLELNKTQKKGLQTLVSYLEEAKTPEEYQSSIFSTCKEVNMSPREFFPVIYRLFINMERGPRVGSLFALIGKDNVIKKIKATLES